MSERIIFSALIKESDETQARFVSRIATLTSTNPPANWKTNAKVPRKYSVVFAPSADRWLPVMLKQGSV